MLPKKRQPGSLQRRKRQDSKHGSRQKLRELPMSRKLLGLQLRKKLLGSLLNKRKLELRLRKLRWKEELLRRQKN